jgi:uncharacterized protein (TIRG00374 family)
MDKRKSMQKIISLSLKILVATGIITFIIWKLGWKEIIATCSNADPQWLIAAIIVFFISGWLGVIQWQIILKNRGVSLPFIKVFSFYFIGMFFNNFAFGIITGDALKVAYIKLQNDQGKAGFAATFLDRFAGLWVMVGYAVFGIILMIRQKALESRSMTLAFVALILAFIGFCGIMMFLLSKKLQDFSFNVIDKLPINKKEILKNIIKETIIESHDIHILLPVGILSTIVQFLRIGVHILCAGALSLLTPFNIHYFFIFVPVLAVIMIVPLPFGVRESIGGALFTMAGFNLHASIVMGFLATIVGSVVSIIGGILFIFNRFNLKKELT